MKHYPYLKSLFQKYSSGSISASELEELLSWLKETENQPIAGQLIQDGLQEENSDQTSVQMDLLLEQVKQNLRHQIVPVKRKRLPLFPITVAASLLIAVGSIVYLALSPKENLSNYNKAQADIMPAGNRATLTLADGSEIDLAKTTSGTLIQAPNLHIVKDGQGRIRYVQDGEAHEKNNKPAFNTIHTPNGGRYQVILPDGTMVWLNAASSLKYPQQFNADTRTVELTGEAYFQVSKNKAKPFIVRSHGQQVTVLGTQFNLNAYMDAPFTFTTLTEGSVLVTNEQNRLSLKIAPGEQAISGSGNLEALKVDPSVYSSWKDGIVVLNDATLEITLRQIERWYDVTFEIKPRLSKIKLSGELPTNTKLSELLAALSIQTGIKFRIEGRRIMAEK